MKNANPLATIVLALVTVSCNYQSSNLDPTLEGFFPEDQQALEMRKPQHFMDAMAASGARADAMLFKDHFDGGRLNSLGEAKLSLMLKDDDSPAPVVVYLSVDEKQGVSAARRDSVIAFLKDKGLKADQIEVKFGSNPDSRSLAKKHLEKLPMTDSASSSTAAGGTTANAGGSLSGGAPGSADSGTTSAASLK